MECLILFCSFTMSCPATVPLPSVGVSIEKHRRPRRTTSGYRADVCEALIPSRKQEAQSASPHKLSQEGRRVSYGSPVRRIHVARMKNPLSAHHIGILRAQKRVKLVLFGCRVLRHGKGTKKIREIVKNLPKNNTL